MDLTPKSGASTAGTVDAAVEVEIGQGDANDETCLGCLKKDETSIPSSAVGTGAAGILKDNGLLLMEMGACSLESTREELLAKRRAVWKDEVKKELEKRAELKRKIEGVPMEQVTKWEDKQFMSKMSTEWREIFKKERIHFLFNEVFPLLFKSPQIYTVNDVLRCREVFTAWKETIDHCVSTTLEPFILGRTASGVFYQHNYPMCVPSFSKVSELTRFNQWSETIPLGRNPFFSRKLYIASSYPPTDGRNNREYWNGIEKLLVRWGGELWMVIIYFHAGIAMEMLYAMLVKYLTLLPNLRRVEICISNEDRFNKLQLDMLRNHGRNVFGPLHGVMATPLPELPHLRDILFDEFIPETIISAVLAKYRGSLELVHLQRKPGEAEVNLLRLSNVKRLLLTSCWISHSTFDFPLLEDMALDGYKVKGTEDVISLFNTVNSCGTPLRRLCLSMEFSGTEQLATNAPAPDPFLTGAVRLELPRLERFLFRVTNTELKNIDFLLGLESLRELDIVYERMANPSGKKSWNSYAFSYSIRSDPDEGDAIQFRGYEDRLYESNIWKLLPELRLVSLKVAVVIPCAGPVLKMMPVIGQLVNYTRDGYKSASV